MGWGVGGLVCLGSPSRFVLEALGELRHRSALRPGGLGRTAASFHTDSIRFACGRAGWIWIWDLRAKTADEATASSLL